MAQCKDWPLVPAKYRVRKDCEGFPYIPGLYGQVEYYDDVLLAGYTDHRLKLSPLLAVPGVTPHQRGDYEVRVLFHPAVLPAVAQVLHLYLKRVQSPAQLKNLQRASKDATSGRFLPRGSKG